MLPARKFLLFTELCLFLAHVVMVSVALVHWNAMRTDDQRVASVNTLALLSFHFCILTPLLLLDAPSQNARSSYAITALAWAYALVIGLCTAVVLQATFGIIALLVCTIVQSACAFFLICFE